MCVCGGGGGVRGGERENNFFRACLQVLVPKLEDLFK
jgi:hypothetical protein